MNDLDFLDSIKQYIEDTEKTIDGEWGSCREFEELYKANLVPDIYDEVLAKIAEVTR